jgi:hypothetical protein
MYYDCLCVSFFLSQELMEWDGKKGITLKKTGIEPPGVFELYNESDTSVVQKAVVESSDAARSNIMEDQIGDSFAAMARAAKSNLQQTHALDADNKPVAISKGKGDDCDGGGDDEGGKPKRQRRGKKLAPRLSGTSDEWFSAVPKENDELPRPSNSRRVQPKRKSAASVKKETAEGAGAGAEKGVEPPSKKPRITTAAKAKSGDNWRARAAAVRKFTSAASSLGMAEAFIKNLSREGAVMKAVKIQEINKERKKLQTFLSDDKLREVHADSDGGLDENYITMREKCAKAIDDLKAMSDLVTFLRSDNKVSEQDANEAREQMWLALTQLFATEDAMPPLVAIDVFVSEVKHAVRSEDLELLALLLSSSGESLQTLKAQRPGRAMCVGSFKVEERHGVVEKALYDIVTNMCWNTLEHQRQLAKKVLDVVKSSGCCSSFDDLLKCTNAMSNVMQDFESQTVEWWNSALHECTGTHRVLRQFSNLPMGLELVTTLRSLITEKRRGARFETKLVELLEKAKDIKFVDGDVCESINAMTSIKKEYDAVMAECDCIKYTPYIGNLEPFVAAFENAVRQIGSYYGTKVAEQVLLRVRAACVRGLRGACLSLAHVF